MKRPTIHDVALAAGISYQTVSRVINSKPDVSKETRERVWKVINEIGYHPSEVARSLIQQRSYTLGVVTAGLKYIGPSRTLNGITQQAEERGYTLLLKELPRFSANNIKPLLDSLLARQVDGIIWAAPEIGDNRKWLEDESINTPVPIIFLEMHDVAGYSVVSVDNYKGGQLATQHLVEQGRKKIAHISGPLDWWESRQRKAGWEDTLKAAGLPCSERSWIEGNWSSSSGEKAIEEICNLYPDLDAVFVANDQMALSVLAFAYKNRIKIPDEIAVIGFDDIAEAAYFCPPLSTIRQDQLNLGCTAVNEIICAIEEKRNNKPCPPKNILLEPQLIIRQSSCAF